MEASSVNSEGSSACLGKRARKSAPRRRTSEAWKFFDESLGKDGLYVLSCTLCSHKYTGITDPSAYGTANLKRHLKKHDLEVKESDEASYAPLDQGVFREKMCVAIVTHNYPFKFVEHERTRELFSFLNPGVRHITRNTVKVDVLKMYNQEKKCVLQLAICLDPRYKLKMVEYCYSMLGYEGDEVEKLVSGVRDKLYCLFEEYKHVSTYSSQCQSASTSTMDAGKKRDVLDGFDTFKSQHHAPNINKSQLDLYLEEEPFDRKLHEKLNVLSYWKGNTLRYPELSMMARDILSVPITSVASESAFSIGGQIFGKYRNSLLPSNAEALICLRDWLNVKYDSDGDGDDKECLVEDFGNLSFASNTESNSHLILAAED